MKQNNVPKLRFKEFSGDWGKKALIELIEFKAGYAFKSELMLSKKNNYQLLKMSNVYQNELRLDRNSSYWRNIDEKQREFLLKSGDTVLTLTGTVGKQDYGYSVQIKEDDKYLLNQRLVLLRAIKNKSSNDFISHIVSTETFLYFFFAEAKGGTGNQTNVSTEDVKKIQLHFPSLPEQTKIASFLSSVDSKLTLLATKKNALIQYKKGVMQQIFNQEIRFKDEDGSDYPDWEEKALGDVGTFFSGGTPLTSKKSFYTGTIPFIKSGEINSLITNQFISIEALKESSAKMVEAGDLLYALYGATSGEVAISKLSGAINQAVLCIRTYLNNIFLCNFLRMQKELILSTYLQGGQGNLSAEIVKSLTIPIPSLPEQTKIASFLTSLDDKINAMNLQIEKVKDWKKGLLQGMFV